MIHPLGSGIGSLDSLLADDFAGGAVAHQQDVDAGLRGGETAAAEVVDAYHFDCGVGIGGRFHAGGYVVVEVDGVGVQRLFAFYRYIEAQTVV